MNHALPELDPPERLLCGPGPTNVDPAVLEAMSRPMLGHLDPAFHEILLELADMLRRVYRMPDGLVLPLQSTGTAGMEAGVVNLLEPGDKVVVGQCGFFGRRIAEMARRHGVSVVPVEADCGLWVSNDALMAALAAHPDARMVAVVHAETSTGVEHPLAELGAALRDGDTLLMADCMSPLAVSERALERVRSRRTAVPFTFDLLALEQYWVERPVTYHHTAPILSIYALHEALRGVLVEGLETRWERHAEAAAHLQAEIESRGLELLAGPDHCLAPLTAVRVPEGVDGKVVQGQLLREHGIEIGGGLGPDAPAMWRIGLMGRNANVETAERVLDALDAVLADERAPALAG